MNIETDTTNTESHTRNTESLIQGIFESAFHRKLDPDACYHGWVVERMMPKMLRVRITALVADGYEVRAGYFTTSVRGFHDHVLLFRRAANPHARALGRLAKGKPKNFSPAERLRRSRRMKRINKKRRTV